MAVVAAAGEQEQSGSLLQLQQQRHHHHSCNTSKTGKQAKAMAMVFKFVPRRSPAAPKFLLQGSVKGAHNKKIPKKRRSSDCRISGQLWPRRNNLTAKRWKPMVQNLLGNRKNWSLRALEGSQISTNGDALGRRRIVITTTGGEGKEEVKSEPLEAILVLAGGQLPGGGLPVWVERRLDKALQLQKVNGPECRIVCLGNGTPYRRPVLTPEGFVIHESSSCAEYLIRKGVPVSVLLKEWGSYDTIGNGFFALTQHAIPRSWRRMAVVTSDFHMPRSRAIFEWVFGLQGAGTSIQPQANNRPVVCFTTGSRSQGFILQYHSVSDDGIDASIIEARRVKERKSLENLMILSPGINTLSDFHAWFHAEHKCYNVEDQGLFGKQALDDPALQSY